jgi:hypothetical protein
VEAMEYSSAHGLAIVMVAFSFVALLLLYVRGEKKPLDV